MSPEIKDVIEKYSKMLPLGGQVSYTEAEKRAGHFLVALAHISEWKHLLTEDKIKKQSILNVVYSEELSKGVDKTVTVNKVKAEASQEYNQAREDLEYLENDISYLKAYQDLFKDGHILYRQLSKADTL